MVAGDQTPPILWQFAQVELVIGTTVCAFAPLVGRPALGAVAFDTLWQPDWVQSVDEVTPATA
jgi:hypothetical protein